MAQVWDGSWPRSQNGSQPSLSARPCPKYHCWTFSNDEPLWSQAYLRLEPHLQTNWPLRSPRFGSKSSKKHAKNWYHSLAHLTKNINCTIQTLLTLWSLTISTQIKSILCRLWWWWSWYLWRLSLFSSGDPLREFKGNEHCSMNELCSQKYFHTFWRSAKKFNFKLPEYIPTETEQEPFMPMSPSSPPFSPPHGIESLPNSPTQVKQSNLACLLYS